MQQTAKLFQHGRSQAVRLPVAFQFSGNFVYIRRDATTGEVILSQRPYDWESFLQIATQLSENERFERDDSTQERVLFSELWLMRVFTVWLF